MIELHNGDCLIEMDKIADKSMDSIIIDPPYFYLYSEDWDNQWGSMDEYLEWINKLLIKLKSKLKENGTIIVFCSQILSDVVGQLVRKHFYLLSNIVWDKTHAAGAEKGVYSKSIRKPVSKTERIILAAKNENPVGDRIRYLLNNYNKTQTALVEYCTGKKTGLVGLWLCKKHKHGACEPTPEMWKKVCNFFNIPDDFTEFSRFFNSEFMPYDLITMPPISGNHPCEKPLLLMYNLVQAVTKESGVVLDATMGSGTTGVACKMTGRHFIGIEQDKKYFDIASNRINGMLL